MHGTGHSKPHHPAKVAPHLLLSRPIRLTATADSFACPAGSLPPLGASPDGLLRHPGSLLHPLQPPSEAALPPHPLQSIPTPPAQPAYLPSLPYTFEPAPGFPQTSAVYPAHHSSAPPYFQPGHGSGHAHNGWGSYRSGPRQQYMQQPSRQSWPHARNPRMQPPAAGMYGTASGPSYPQQRQQGRPVYPEFRQGTDDSLQQLVVDLSIPDAQYHSPALPSQAAAVTSQQQQQQHAGVSSQQHAVLSPSQPSTQTTNVPAQQGKRSRGQKLRDRAVRRRDAEAAAAAASSLAVQQRQAGGVVELVEIKNTWCACTVATVSVAGMSQMQLLCEWL